MKAYIDSEDFLYYLKHEQEQEKPKKQIVEPKQKEIIAKKVLVIFGIVVIIKIIVLLLWIWSPRRIRNTWTELQIKYKRIKLFLFFKFCDFVYTLLRNIDQTVSKG